MDARTSPAARWTCIRRWRSPRCSSGAALLGPIGALIGIPLMAAAITVIQTYTHRYELVPELAAREAGEKPDRRPTPVEDPADDPLEDPVADPAEPRFE